MSKMQLSEDMGMLPSDGGVRVGSTIKLVGGMMGGGKSYLSDRATIEEWLSLVLGDYTSPTETFDKGSLLILSIHRDGWISRSRYSHLYGQCSTEFMKQIAKTSKDAGFLATGFTDKKGFWRIYTDDSRVRFETNHKLSINMLRGGEL